MRLLIVRSLLLLSYALQNALPVCTFQVGRAVVPYCHNGNKNNGGRTFCDDVPTCTSTTTMRTRTTVMQLFPFYSAPTVIGSDRSFGALDGFNQSLTSSCSSSSLVGLDCSSTGTASAPVSACAGKIAVILNTNARAVTTKVERMVKQIFSDDENDDGTVFVTTTAEEAQAAAQAIVNDMERYRLVVLVGGDGTLTAAIDYLVQAILQNKQQHQPQWTVAEAIRALPVIGYVPLGTGNGVGSVVGCTLNRKIRRAKQLQHVLESLKQVAATSTSNQLGSAPKMETSVVELPMMQVNTSTSRSGDLCFFAGGMWSVRIG